MAATGQEKQQMQSRRMSRRNQGCLEPIYQDLASSTIMNERLRHCDSSKTIKK
jgi:hypothetical protein